MSFSFSNIQKIIRYAFIYGLSRAFVKSVSHLRLKIRLPNFSKRRYISIIGCGQFAFSTICYFLYFGRKKNFYNCYDIDFHKSKSLSTFWGFKSSVESPNDIFDDKKTRLIYIASNHFTHTEYAIEALKRDIDVYVEKPISVSKEQFYRLKRHLKQSQSNFYVGYNRPHSKAVKLLSKFISDAPFSIQCFISGHVISHDHWYRNDNEGTRICGNMGHWIDLGIYLFNLRGRIPRKYHISLQQADPLEPDDNIVVNISTEYNDLISIFLTSRSEPFEGINETINILNSKLICKIDDFRKMQIWIDGKYKSYRFRPKDVGHKNAIFQPFNETKRDIKEVFASTQIMLEVTEMVNSGIKAKTITIEE